MRGSSRIEDNEFIMRVLVWPACVLVSPGRPYHSLNVPGTVRAQGEVTGETVVPAVHSRL